MSTEGKSLVQDELWPGTNLSYRFPPSFNGEGDPTFERCEAFTPAPDNAKAQRLHEDTYKFTNPITKWMASHYKTRDEQEIWLRDYCARAEEGADKFRMKCAQPVHFKDQHLQHIRTEGQKMEKAMNAERPKPGGGDWALWEYLRKPGDKRAAFDRSGFKPAAYVHSSAQ